MRILAGGVVIEDIDDFARVSEMFSTLRSANSRVNDDAEGFGTRNNLRRYGEVPLGSGEFNTDTFHGIKGGQSQTVLFKPLSGLLMQEKYIPLRYCPLTIELELTDDNNSPIISPPWDTTFADQTKVFKADNTSLLYHIENVQVKVDLCTLDNALDNSFAQHLLDGGTLPINYNTYISQIMSTIGGMSGTGATATSVGQKDIQHTITRAVSRLKSVFVTFDKDVAGEEIFKGRRPWNDFYSPMHTQASGAVNRFDSEGEFEFQLQVGSKQFPDGAPIRSHAEAYYQLRKCLGVQSSSLHNFDIDTHDYRNWKMIIGIDTEMVLSAGFTGLNLKSGDMLTIKFKHNSSDVLAYATKMHVILHSDNVLSNRDRGVEVLD